MPTFSCVSMFYRRLVFSLTLLAFCTTGFAQELTLHPEKSGPDDLAISGELVGFSSNETRWVRWADLRGLPTQTLTVENEFVPGPQTLTVVLLKDLLAKLPRTGKADTLLADCVDGYAAIFRQPYIDQSSPFLVLEINGAGPTNWPPQGLDFNPAPYAISVSDQLAPGVSSQLDVAHKRPWGVNALRLVNYETHFAPMYTGNWSTLSRRAQAGREIWVNACYSCHLGPVPSLGGAKSGRAFDVLKSLAASNRSYFTTYVRAPKNLNPQAKMSPHPHYTDDQIKSLIAFVIAEKPSPVHP